MRNLTLIAAMCLGLTACSTEQLLAQHDDQACRAKGLEVGTTGYVDCRAAMDKQRADNQTDQRPLKLRYVPGTPGVSGMTPNY